MSEQDAPRSSPRSSAALRTDTGRDYAEWFALLDEWGAPGRPYAEIAAWLTTDQLVSDWWAQKLIVEYEQDRGLREPGARPDGTFTGGASKTVAVPAERLYDAFTDPTVRTGWLPGIELTERNRKAGRSVRFDLADGSRLTVLVAAQGDTKAQASVEQERLPSATAARDAKAFWRERLAVLKSQLETTT